MSSHVIDRPTIVLYDADCGLCVAGIGWLKARVSADRVVAVPFQAADADPRLSQLLAGRDLGASLHAVMPDDRVRTGAAAVLAAGRAVPAWGILARLYDNAAGRAFLEPGYRLVARNRRRIGHALRLDAACALP